MNTAAFEGVIADFAKGGRCHAATRHFFRSKAVLQLLTDSFEREWALYERIRKSQRFTPADVTSIIDTPEQTLNSKEFEPQTRFVNLLLKQELPAPRVKVRNLEGFGRYYRRTEEVHLHGMLQRDVRNMIYAHEFAHHHIDTIPKTENDPRNKYFTEGIARGVERNYARRRLAEGSMIESFFDAKESAAEIAFTCKAYARGRTLPPQIEHVKAALGKRGWVGTRLWNDPSISTCMHAIGHAFFYLWEKKDGPGVYRRALDMVAEQRKVVNE